MTADTHIGVIGYGEVGRALAVAFAERGLAVSAYDLSWDGVGDEIEPGVAAATSNQQIAERSTVVFVCTPAAAIEAVAADLSGRLGEGTLVADLASATAESKIRASRLLGSQADQYIDIALSAPPMQDGLAARMYASGGRARELMEWSAAHGMDIRFLGQRVGQATQLKILRATITKGLEAILYESLTTALLHDVDPDTVMATIESAFDDRPFYRFCEYLVSTGVVHDGRRAVEIGEAALMAENVGIEADMARGAERVLRRAAALHGQDDPQSFRSALRTYARSAGERRTEADADLALGRLA